jgi:hypothetical protein
MGVRVEDESAAAFVAGRYGDRGHRRHHGNRLTGDWVEAARPRRFATDGIEVA